jgi:protein TonB
MNAPVSIPRIESMSLTLRRSLFPALATLLLAGPLARSAAAQDDKVYPIAEVTNPPKLSSTVQAARLISESYPADLKSRGVGGMVELQFVVDSKG